MDLFLWPHITSPPCLPRICRRDVTELAICRTHQQHSGTYLLPVLSVLQSCTSEVSETTRTVVNDKIYHESGTAIFLPVGVVGRFPRFQMPAFVFLKTCCSCCCCCCCCFPLSSTSRRCEPSLPSGSTHDGGRIRSNSKCWMKNMKQK